MALLDRRAELLGREPGGMELEQLTQEVVADADLGGELAGER
jgi:hypothetical protein